MYVKREKEILLADPAIVVLLKNKKMFRKPDLIDFRIIRFNMCHITNKLIHIIVDAR